MMIGSISIENTAVPIASLAANAPVAVSDVSGAFVAVDASVRSEGAGSDFSQTLTATATAGKADLDAIFEAAAARYGVPIDLLKAVAKTESGFRVDATSQKGAMGVMQLMPGTARGLGVTDAYNPEQNIMGGAKYLSQMLTRFGGNVEYALAGYNAGPGAVDKYGGIPPYNETQNYVRTVTRYMGEGNLSAGWASYSSDLTGRIAGKDEDSMTMSMLSASMSKMILMRIIEMQMNSSDKDEEKKVF